MFTNTPHPHPSLSLSQSVWLLPVATHVRARTHFHPNTHDMQTGIWVYSCWENSKLFFFFFFFLERERERLGGGGGGWEGAGISRHRGSKRTFQSWTTAGTDVGIPREICFRTTNIRENVKAAVVGEFQVLYVGDPENGSPRRIWGPKRELSWPLGCFSRCSKVRERDTVTNQHSWVIQPGLTSWGWQTFWSGGKAFSRSPGFNSRSAHTADSDLHSACCPVKRLVLQSQC